MVTAYEIKGAIDIIASATHDGICVLQTPCHSSEEFNSLPRVIRAVEFGRTGNFVKTAWNSDHNVAYYRDDKTIAYSLTPTHSILDCADCPQMIRYMSQHP